MLRVAWGGRAPRSCHAPLEQLLAVQIVLDVTGVGHVEPKARTPSLPPFPETIRIVRVSSHPPHVRAAVGIPLSRAVRYTRLARRWVRPLRLGEADA